MYAQNPKKVKSFCSVCGEKNRYDYKRVFISEEVDFVNVFTKSIEWGEMVYTPIDRECILRIVRDESPDSRAYRMTQIFSQVIFKLYYRPHDCEGSRDDEYVPVKKVLRMALPKPTFRKAAPPPVKVEVAPVEEIVIPIVSQVVPEVVEMIPDIVEVKEEVAILPLETIAVDDMLVNKTVICVENAVSDEPVRGTPAIHIICQYGENPKDKDDVHQVYPAFISSGACVSAGNMVETLRLSDRRCDSGVRGRCGCCPRMLGGEGCVLVTTSPGGLFVRLTRAGHHVYYPPAYVKAVMVPHAVSNCRLRSYMSACDIWEIGARNPGDHCVWLTRDKGFLSNMRAR